MAIDARYISAMSDGKCSISLAGARSANMEVPHLVEVHQWNGGEYTNVFRPKSANVAMDIAQYAARICSNNNFLYSMDKRYTGYNALKKANWDVESIRETVYLDCSSLVGTCCNHAGMNIDIGDFTTKSEVSELNATGQFTQVVVSQTVTFQSQGLKIGDILHRDGHTEIIVGIGGLVFGGTSIDYAGGAIGEGDYTELYYTSMSNGITGIKTKTTITTTNVLDYSYEYIYDTVTRTYTVDEFVSAEQEEDTIGTGLLSYPTLVETPFILLKVGDYVFGTYKQSKTGYKAPNYIKSMTIKKINGEVNQYTIILVHKIEAGADPNFVDKIFSTAKYGATVHITYGDYSAATLAYKDEEAVLLKVTNTVDFASSTITYTVNCTSNATKLYAALYDFTDGRYTGMHKPSSVIKDMLWGSGAGQYKLTDAFNGMISLTACSKHNLIPTDDVEVELFPKVATDPLNYINYLVSCMCSNTSDPNSPLKDSTYKMAIYDSSFGYDDLDGAYFKIQKMSTSDGRKTSLSTADVFEVDVGYPTNNMVVNFSVKTDQTWAMLYDYAGESKEFVYSIDGDGKLNTAYVPKLAVSRTKNKMTEKQRDWWTNMTKFPIQAELTIKGLVRPAMLMSYVRINALFYGLRHITSGLYFITAENDSIDASGFRTTLSLTRVAGDDEYIKKVEKTETLNIPVSVVSHATVTTETYENEYETNYIWDEDYSFVTPNGSELASGGYICDGQLTVDDGAYITYYPDVNDSKSQLAVAKLTAACVGLIADGYSPTKPIKQITIQEDREGLIKFLATYLMNRYEYYRSIGLLSANTMSLEQFVEAGYFGTMAKEFAQSCIGTGTGTFKTPSGYTFTITDRQIKNECWDVFLGTQYRMHEYNICDKWTNIKSVDNSPEQGFEGTAKNLQQITSVLKKGTSVVTNHNGSKYQACSPDDCVADLIFGKIKCGDHSIRGGSLNSSKPNASQLWQKLVEFFSINGAVNPKACAAGTLGNVWHESAGGSDLSIAFNRLQFSAVDLYKKNCGITHTDESYTAAVDAGIKRGLIGDESNNAMPNTLVISQFEFLHMPWKTYSLHAKENETYPWGCQGYGMCLWTQAKRKLALYNLCKSRGVSISDGGTLLEYLLNELSSGYRSTTLVPMCKATTVEEACRIFFTKFEGAGDDSVQLRINKANEYYQKFGGT